MISHLPDPKIAVVTGDVTMDWNIAHQHLEGEGMAWNSQNRTHAYLQRGGAALLADLIEDVAKDLRQKKQADFDVYQTGAPHKDVDPSDARFHHSYAMWFQFEDDVKLPPDKGKKVWRVKEFLGMNPSTAGESSDTSGWKSVKDDTPEANLVVLDDANLGFRHRKKQGKYWPKAITNEDCNPWILLKMARPVAQGDLWKHLYSRFADRLIVVMTVNDLRLMEVQISRELSWERTAQDLVWELLYNPQVNALSRCKYVVISFDTAGALLLSRPAAKNEMPDEDTAPKCHLFFDPKVIEGMWGRDHPGGMIGYTSCLTAGIIRQFMISPEQPDIKEGIKSGLAAMRKLHLEGYDKPDSEASQLPLIFPTKSITTELAKDESPFAEVEIQNPRRFLAQPAAKAEKASKTGYWTILEDQYKDTLDQVARDIVKKGAEATLQGIPMGQFGSLLTVDRREIESFRSIRALVGEYCNKDRQKRPLSIAVFGAPGSGKSFGIVEVARSLLPGQIKVIEYNLSQFSDPEELLGALHQVRDVGLSGLVPLVFWDEFDTSLDEQPLGWLRHFLAPMQDGHFQDGQITHPIGRSIFVFAGGLYESMKDFEQKMDPEKFRAVKGPDFVSRLKGYVNILGPNQQETPKNGTNNTTDLFYLIRRAILLRTILLHDAPQLFKKNDNKELVLDIDKGVLRALLFTTEYKHGVRSMESIIAMSLLTNKHRFERSCLPAVAQLDLHVDSSNFQSLVQHIELEDKLLEDLAKAVHKQFCKRQSEKEINEVGSQTNDELKAPSSSQPYDELPEDEKQQNRGFVRDIPNKLAHVGYMMISARNNERPFTFSPDEIEQLAEMEHERWMQVKLKAGWHWAAETDKDNKLHKALLPWRKPPEAASVTLNAPVGAEALGRDELPEEEKEKDRDLVRDLPQILAGMDYTITKIPKETGEKSK